MVVGLQAADQAAGWGIQFANPYFVVAMTILVTLISLNLFGVFEVRIRKARIGRNPNSPERDVPIPPRAVVKFKPGKEMREAVLKLTPAQIQPPSSPSP